MKNLFLNYVLNIILIFLGICMSTANLYGQKAASGNLSSSFNFKSNYIEINGSKIHYVDEGEGDPILLIHGNPTWSYVWRNIIPELKPYGRVIAFDLIGFGKSGKPEIEYSFLIIQNMLMSLLINSD